MPQPSAPELLSVSPSALGGYALHDGLGRLVAHTVPIGTPEDTRSGSPTTAAVNFAYAKLFAASESMLAHLENDLRARRLWRQDMEECGFDSREAEREEKLRAEYSIIKKLESVIDLARPR